MDRTGSDMNAKKGTRGCMPKTVWATLSSKPPPSLFQHTADVERCILRCRELRDGAQDLRFLIKSTKPMKEEDIVAHHTACGSMHESLRALAAAKMQDGSDEGAEGDEITLGKYKRLNGLGSSLTMLQDQWHQLLLIHAE